MAMLFAPTAPSLDDAPYPSWRALVRRDDSEKWKVTISVFITSPPFLSSPPPRAGKPAGRKTDRPVDQQTDRYNVIARAIVIVVLVSFSEKVVVAASGRGRYSTVFVGHGAEYAEPDVEILADVHDRGHVAAAVTVVRSRPHRDHVSVLEVVL